MDDELMRCYNHSTCRTRLWVCLAVRDSPVVASVDAAISQTVIKSTTTHMAPLIPICVYRSLILGDRKRDRKCEQKLNH